MAGKKTTIKVKWLANAKYGKDRYKRGDISDLKKTELRELEEKGLVMAMEIIEEETEIKEG